MKLPLYLFLALITIMGLVALSTIAATPLRDLDGSIHRSRAALHRFHVSTGHPRGWKDHVVDHILPLASGGPDDPINMQWQTLDEGKAKDGIERLPAAVALEKEILACRKWRAQTAPR